MISGSLTFSMILLAVLSSASTLIILSVFFLFDCVYSLEDDPVNKAIEQYSKHPSNLKSGR